MPAAVDVAHARVKELARDFERHHHVYTSSEYSEAQARQDFIDKLLNALGWDVHHAQQRNPFEQEVKVERNVNVGGTSQRRADYALYISPNFRDVRLYIEAKKPRGALATADNYFQAIRYGWNSQTPLAVLTSFGAIVKSGVRELIRRRPCEALDCRSSVHVRPHGRGR